MRTVIHRTHGTPAQVLEYSETAAPHIISPGSALVRVRYVPIHPGDLLAIEGSPAYSTTPVPIEPAGRFSGLEGVGTIAALAEDFDPGLKVSVGSRVAFFPYPGTWKEWIVVPGQVLVPLPDSVSDSAAANFLIDVISAAMILRTTTRLLKGYPVIQTGAGSAVGRVITLLLQEQGIFPIRLVRSTAGAAALQEKLPGGPIISTDSSGWKVQLDEAIGSKQVSVAFDGVGGALLADVAACLETGGEIVNYGSLGGHSSDIRLLVPRALTIRGASVARWVEEPEYQRKADVATALRLVQAYPSQFEPAGIYAPNDFVSAVEHVRAVGKSGGVLFDFGTESSEDTEL